MPNGAVKIIMPIGRHQDHGLLAFHASTLSFWSCVCSYFIFQSDEYFKLKINVLAQFLDDGCIFLFDVVIYY